jgi:hypothetical protein
MKLNRIVTKCDISHLFYKYFTAEIIQCYHDNSSYINVVDNMSVNLCACSSILNSKHISDAMD